ncbi:MAG: GNAT family N-acetyltransferase [Bacteroidota bacterium]
MIAGLNIRPITEADDAVIAKIIRDSLTEFNCALPGTAFADPETDHVSRQFTTARTIYYVAELNDAVVGGAGINLLEGEALTCELQKLYLHKKARGKGIASLLLEYCISFAVSAGYEGIYLETKKELEIAVPLYEKKGFEYLDHAMGNTGHFNCEIRMLKKL